MFVLESKYKAKCQEVRVQQGVALLYREKFISLQREWNALVARVNARGGERFLAGPTNQFTPEEITRLILLCHPDKHDGKQMATEMTAKLLHLKESK